MLRISLVISAQENDAVMSAVSVLSTVVRPVAPPANEIGNSGNGIGHPFRMARTTVIHAHYTLDHPIVNSLFPTTLLLQISRTFFEQKEENANHLQIRAVPVLSFLF